MTVIRPLRTQGKSLIFAHRVGLFFIVFLKQNSAEFSVLVLWTNSVILISYKPLNIYHNPTKHKVKQTYFSFPAQEHNKWFKMQQAQSTSTRLYAFKHLKVIESESKGSKCEVFPQETESISTWLTDRTGICFA